jgi:integrase
MPKLTDRIVKALKPPVITTRISQDGKSYRAGKIYWDSDVHGFGCRVTASGAKSFVLLYRTHTGRLRQITIGKYPAYSTEVARKDAKEHLHIIGKGGDPAADRKATREAPTFADLADEYCSKHLPKKRASSALTDRQAIDAELLPVLGKLKVSDITYDNVAGIHHQITKRGKKIRANRVVALLSKMFSLAVRKRWRADNPAKGIERNEEHKRERYLSDDELARLTKTLDTWHDQQAANAVRLLLYTGARRGEVLSAEWKQFDLDEGIWTKPSAHTKTRKTHTVPLSPAAVSVLSKMRAEAKSISPYLFPGRGGGHPRVDLKKPWPAICKAAEIEGLRLHDLRHSFASILVAGGATLPMIGRLLGHTQVSTTQRYAHLDVDPLRELVAKVGAVVDGANKVADEKATKAGGKLVKMERRR